MSKTISSSISTGITLTAAYDPLIITTTGTIESGNAAAIYGNASRPWQIDNAGLVEGLGNYGIDLLAGSTVTNTGTVSSNGVALRIADGAGTVNSSGTISGFLGGISLADGGSVTNTGTIAGVLGDGIEIIGRAGTVTNAGTIGGHVYAVQFGGNFADRVIVDAGAVFSGKVAGGSGSNALELAKGKPGVTGTLTGFGTNFTGFGTLSVDSGASWQLDNTSTVASGVTLGVAGSLANAGVIESIVTVAAGGRFSNTGTVENLVTVAGGASLDNGGTITCATQPWAVYLLDGGNLTNTGEIAGNLSDGEGVDIGGVTGEVTNGGTIIGGNFGVVLSAGGTVLNTGLIFGGITGLEIVGAGTVTNAGTIIGGTDSSFCLVFSGSYTDRLIVDPGAVFNGSVLGGSGSNTLELAADPASPSAAGTLASMAGFEGFGTITIDSGATWQFGAGSMVGAGETVYDAGTLSNAGTIESTVTVSGTGLTNSGIIYGSAWGVLFTPGGGTVTNTGLIENIGSQHGSFQGYGVAIAGGSGFVKNTGGTIAGEIGGVVLESGGSVQNSGEITGTELGVIIDGAGAVTNSGTIYGGSLGIYLQHGTITNTGDVTSNPIGLEFAGAGTLINSGIISGSSYAAIFFGDHTDRVIADPGAVFLGLVKGGSGTNTLELAAGKQHATGTLNNIGYFTTFGTIVVDSGAKWQLDGASAVGQDVTLAGTHDLLALPDDFLETINGFNASDELDIVGLTYSIGATATLSGDSLFVTSGTATEKLTLDGLAPGTKFVAAFDGTRAGGTLVQEAACYCRGTRILTGRGEIAVENLNIGDLIVTASGASRPVKWIGRRAYAPHFANANPRLLPIRFNAGSLGENLPLRDLHVSPKHAMFIDGVLIPAECLVNGVSIVKTTRVDTELAYWHIELETHDVLLAEAAPSETFVDDNSRSMFHNAHEYWAEHPGDAGRQAVYCAPRVEDGYELAAIRARLAEIAGIARPPTHGGLAGYFAVGNGSVSGWARNELYPGASVCLDILLDGKRVAQTLANQTLPALAAGPHAFDIRLPAAYRGAVQVRRSIDGANLPPASPRAQAA